LAYLRLKRYVAAEEDVSAVIARRPLQAQAYLWRALAREGQKQLRAAKRDLDEALKLGAPATRAYAERSRIRAALGDGDGAAADRLRALRHTPTDEEGWILRGVLRLPPLAKKGQIDVSGALADFAQAVRLNPRSLPAL